MTDKQTYWIADAEGVKARVTSAGARDHWVRVKGWTEADEPTGQEFVWVRNEAPDHNGKGVMNHEALLLAGGRGWVASGPPGYDDESALPPIAEPKSSPSKSANSGDKKE